MKTPHFARLATLCVAAFLSSFSRGAEPELGPRLAVVISIDQCRADYLARFRPFFGPDGFRRLLDGGAVFEDCHQRHAVTNTAPGHATILTGVHANIHGIISNEWRDPETLTQAAAVEDENAPLVGLAPSPWRSPNGALEKMAGRSPRRLLATTVGDQLKLRYPQSSHVIGISIKDRQSILLAGQLADAAYWLERGTFVTSRYYRDTLPDWVAQFNSEKPIDQLFGQTWDRLGDAELYNRIQGPDAAAGEESRLGLGTTFPRRLDGGAEQLGPKFYDAFRLTPMVGDITLELVKRGVIAEKLGRHATPDLLCIGFPQVDYGGHSFGPDSHEVMDLLLRLDRTIAQLLSFLDAEVGAGKYVMVVTADHGVTPLPERIAAFNRDLLAGRFDDRELSKQIEATLAKEFGAPPEGYVWAVRDSYGYRITPAALQLRHAKREDVAARLRDVVAAWPQVASAYTRAEVLAAPANDQSVIGRVRLSYYPARSQDVVFVLQPFIVDRSPTGTNHGGPYDCDDHVPLIFYGAGISPSVRIERVGVDNIAPTLSALLRIPPPPQAAAGRLF